jgi:DNA-binding transcriptional MerR regulator
MRLLTSGDTARELGISVEWLRKLERKGVIPKAKRLPNQRRVYTDEDLKYLRQILMPSMHDQPKAEEDGR